MNLGQFLLIKNVIQTQQNQRLTNQKLDELIRLEREKERRESLDRILNRKPFVNNVPPRPNPCQSFTDHMKELGIEPSSNSKQAPKKKLRKNNDWKKPYETLLRKHKDIIAHLKGGQSMNKTANITGKSISTVTRVRDAMDIMAHHAPKERRIPSD